MNLEDDNIDENNKIKCTSCMKEKEKNEYPKNSIRYCLLCYREKNKISYNKKKEKINNEKKREYCELCKKFYNIINNDNTVHLHSIQHQNAMKLKERKYCEICNKSFSCMVFENHKLKHVKKCVQNEEFNI